MRRPGARRWWRGRAQGFTTAQKPLSLPSPLPSPFHLQAGDVVPPLLPPGFLRPWSCRVVDTILAHTGAKDIATLKGPPPSIGGGGRNKTVPSDRISNQRSKQNNFRNAHICFGHQPTEPPIRLPLTTDSFGTAAVPQHPLHALSEGVPMCVCDRVAACRAAVLCG